ncbi:TIP41-like protein [Parasteatoda tepidariorum]|uniref:TIP41-like protein n=1 Tax=Parasteatoda tepidariorum TaxID=114398 RepID=UPI001C7193CE|nr:TIP41-like protein [Parasteatoda tepidariorum]
MAQSSTFPSHVAENTFKFPPWTVIVRKSHILQSRCTNVPNCHMQLNDTFSKSNLCDFCLYEKELDLPQLPEMTFAGNLLHVEHSKELGIEFNALSALQLVDSKFDSMKVAVAEAWQESRLDNSEIKDVVKPFDWTFTTHYKGTLIGNKENYTVTPTDERINIEKLKVKEKILFYEDVMLFEDELADNGTAHCSVKIRIMPDCFFILMRYFLRVDNLLVRIIDTRIFHEVGKSYILQEHVTKESKVKELKVDVSLLRNPQLLWDHLPTVDFQYEKIQF